MSTRAGCVQWGKSYHTLGAVRIKPGRGDPTQSLSCSDKMTKWNLAGLQGSLLSAMVSGVIKWSSITMRSDQYHQESLSRPLFQRLHNNTKSPDTVKLYSSKKVPFRFGKDGGGSRPCRCSIAYNSLGLHQILVDGRKQGIVKKHFNTEKASLTTCPKTTAAKFVNLLKDMGQISLLLSASSYSQLKNLCKSVCQWGYADKLLPFEALLSAEQQSQRKKRRDEIDNFSALCLEKKS